MKAARRCMCLAASSGNHEPSCPIARFPPGAPAHLNVSALLVLPQASNRQRCQVAAWHLAAQPLWASRPRRQGVQHGQLAAKLAGKAGVRGGGAKVREGSGAALAMQGRQLSPQAPHVQKHRSDCRHAGQGDADCQSCRRGGGHRRRRLGRLSGARMQAFHTVPACHSSLSGLPLVAGAVYSPPELLSLPPGLATYLEECRPARQRCAARCSCAPR